MAEVQSIARLNKKTKAGIADYNISFTLDTSDVLASARVSLISPSTGIDITVNSVNTAGATAVIDASGGTSGQIYYFNVFVKTLGAREFERMCVLPVGQV